MLGVPNRQFSRFVTTRIVVPRQRFGKARRSREFRSAVTRFYSFPVIFGVLNIVTGTRCSPMQEIPSGKWCMFEILTQDGPLSKKVCQLTNDLIRLADQCFDEESMKVLQKTLPPDTKVGKRLGALVGGELHKVLYDRAVQAREAGTLESRLKITRPTNRKMDPKYTRRGERSAAGPDFVLSGLFDGENVHAAWDFTTSGALAGHYDRDVRGIRRRRKSDPEEHPLDPEIQNVPDTANFWSSYIAIFY
jgi:hypothetical protein